MYDMETSKTLKEERRNDMNKEEFITLSPKKRVEEVNMLLRKHSLKEIANILGFKYSTFTTEIRSGGEYKFDKKNQQYARTIAIQDEENSLVENEVLIFIKHNKQTLQRLVDMYQSNNLLFLDERVYSKNAKFENKSIKMNKDIYKEFSEFCDAYYNHLKLQDLIAQAILDFMERYKR